MILKVKQNENPYDVIGNYIEKYIPVIDDIIAVISIDGEIHNELLLVDVEISSTNNFVWQIDWWEGEENVELIDFFFVSDACKKNNNNDLISREQAIDAMAELQGRASSKGELTGISKAWKKIKQLPPIQPEIIYCKDCKHFVREDREEYTPYGFYNTYFNAFCDKHFDVNLGEFIDVKLDDFCSFAERRE